MRMTFNALNRHLQGTIQNRYGDLAKLQEQLSTGKRLLRPSDDPIGVANDLKLRTKVDELTQYNTNLDDGLAFMNVSDTAMQSMNNLMQRCRELALQASNDTMTANERVFIQKEVEQLTRQVVAIANTNYKGDYIFAGSQTKITPFPVDASLGESPENYTGREMAYYDGSAGVGTAAQLRDAFNDRPLGRIIPGSFNISRGGTTYHEGVDYTVDYVNATITPLHADLAVDISEGGQFDAGPNGYYSSGNANSVSIRFEYIGTGSNIYGEAVSHHGNIMREIEVGVEMPVNITSNELFLNQTTGQHTMDVLLALSENLLQNNSAGINQNIGDIDNVFKTILAAQSKNGARINRFDTTLERNEMQFTESTRLLAEVEDAEFAETVANFNLLQTVYDAALRSGAKIIQPSLVNFL